MVKNRRSDGIEIVSCTVLLVQRTSLPFDYEQRLFGYKSTHFCGLVSVRLSFVMEDTIIRPVDDF